MRKIRKSRSEIEKEVQAIFRNRKPANEIILNIEEYLGKVTHKELINCDEILSIIYDEVHEYDEKMGTKLLNNKKIKLILEPIFQGIKEYEEIITESPDFDIDCPVQALIATMYFVCDEFKELRRHRYPTIELGEELSKENKSFKNLYSFLLKNKESAQLISDFSDQNTRYVIKNLIIDNIIPLQAILMYFDDTINIKQNTELFYRMLEKTFSRQSIQACILDNIDDISGGKFSVPYEY
ncbi:MAG: hypothetical protein WC644_09330 [Ignavibacteria bacterium]